MRQRLRASMSRVRRQTGRHASQERLERKASAAVALAGRALLAVARGKPADAARVAMLFPMLLVGPSWARTGSPAADHGPAPSGFEQRRDSVLAAQVADPFPRPVLRGGRSSRESMRVGPDHLGPLASARLRKAGGRRAGRPAPPWGCRGVAGARGLEAALPFRGAPHAPARVDPGLDFPFLTATLLRRAVGLFGSGRAGARQPSRSGGRAGDPGPFLDLGDHGMPPRRRRSGPGLAALGKREP